MSPRVARTPEMVFRLPWHLVAVALGLLVLAALALSPRVASAEELAEPALAEAQAAIVTDQVGNVLYGKNVDAQINMASITKVMTAVVALESEKPLDETYELQEPTELQPEAVVAGYHAGQTSTLRDLFNVMLVKSANDAAWEVATICAGSEEAFVNKMNEKAAELGMTNTHFANSHGLDAEGHHSSVADLAKLARYAMQTHPLIAKTVRQRSVTLPVAGIPTTFETSDDLLYTYEGILGIKTGAGNTVTSFLGSARRDGTTLYTCVLGCETKQGRFDDTERLLDWAWDTYDAYTLADSSAPLAVLPFSLGFGWSCVARPDLTTTGLVWPQGGTTTYVRYLAPDAAFAAPGDVVADCQWVQDGRVVATASYSAAQRLVPTYSGFGPLDRMNQARADLAA